MLKLPEDVKYIINVLNKNNFEAYVVGGCVRDSILNRSINDWDITTNAKPDEVVKLFDKTIKTGIQHGTVTVVLNNENYEVTTYRLDGNYVDGRHPEEIHFVSNLKEDLARRDFTINALAYNEENGLQDYYRGVEDLQNKIIRAVGDPLKRFDEDALRMLRAIRFSSQLDFEIEESTFNAIKELSYSINRISIERIREEFNKIIISNPYGIYKLIDTNLLKEFLPELLLCHKVKQQNPHHIYDVLEHIIKSASIIESRLDLRLTMILHDICKPQCKTVDEKGIGHFYGHPQRSSKKAFEILKRMKYDNETIKRVTTLVLYHDRDMPSFKSIRKVLSEIGVDLFNDLLKVKEADALAQNPLMYQEKHERLELIKEKLKKIIEDNNCFSIKDLDINGRDVIALGAQGKDVGRVLNSLLSKVIEKPELNCSEKLIKLAKKMI
ncbi:MAG: CCA tRNA nucleotidyltransferase [Clostridium sp.]|nr:CCA tRNA nucleotidyltransferase [Clostridium sp.]MDY3828768.1 CCA tRNA nucleotidyltransferase [Clostridium sp.]